MQSIFNVDERENTIFFSKIYSADATTVWNYYTKPELLEQWWMPQPWQAKVLSQDFSEGGKILYAALGPKGEKQYSGSTYNEIHQNRSLSITDYFTDESGNIKSEMPVTEWLVGFTGVEEGTKVTINMHFKSAEDLKQTLDMGFREGLLQAAEHLENLLQSKN